ncbi:MAG: flavin reductase family protein [Clostridiales Family XIII bacterium]|jgi:flavin reductase (DIM6/NTAB) family NADH-FMN oxidoreductase RutF|nr:flavin reductase family protein [Clostridiales Family XIII bacterium]
MKKSIGAQPATFPNPVFIVGTYGKDGAPDVATFAWGGTAASDPPALSVSVRPSRLTYENLLLKKAFTVSLPSAQYAAEADYFGIVSGRDADKFAKTGLTPVRAEFVDAPYVEEFPVNIECVVTQSLELGSHVLFVGEIKDIKVDEALAAAGANPWADGKVITFGANVNQYLAPGEEAAKAFSAGLKYR